MTPVEVDIVDALARRLRATLGSPLQRDLLAAAGMLTMIGAIALWKPVLALFLFGALLVIAAFVASIVTTAAPGKELSDGDGQSGPAN